MLDIITSSLAVFSISLSYREAFMWRVVRWIAFCAVVAAFALTLRGAFLDGERGLRMMPWISLFYIWILWLVRPFYRST